MKGSANVVSFRHRKFKHNLARIISKIRSRILAFIFSIKHSKISGTKPKVRKIKEKNHI